jgi:hypothetical protein
VDSKAVHDISNLRIQGASAGDGLAWYLESTGIVYYRRDASKPYNVSPNEVIARSRAATEIRRIAIVLPTNAAVVVNARNTVTLANNSKIRGGTSPGLGYNTGGTPSVTGGSSISGSTTYQSFTPAINISTIFGVSQNELKLMADYAVSSANDLPADYPSMAVVFVGGDATFNDQHKLRGGGILYVNGNLTIDDSSNALFSGLIFVTGNVTINGPALISGALVCQGTVRMDGSVDVPEVDYDSSILDSVRQQVAQYRENKAVYYSFSGTQ